MKMLRGSMRRQSMFALLISIILGVGLRAQTVLAEEPAPELEAEPAQPQADKPLNTDRLWLPGSYAIHWSKLREIAELALASERCVEVLRGELAQTQSTQEAPVFAIMCRDANRKTYVDKFNGLKTESFAAALIPRAGAEEVAEQVAEVNHREVSAALYARCRELWQEQVKLMNALSWQSDIENVEPVEITDLSEGNWHYRFLRNFNAKNAAGVTLRYVAVCEGPKVFELTSRIDIRTTP
ncbi:hypothetical protein L1F30_14080 [Simiduia sp. 21SJ11W-1]|uniref:hypothetical protein n=1 Tax=Simiduia sp. 21SJ11W-1 TaxID=2909669 RepID=UPI00209F2209|nr:hypothetical protein [Simiduia sp. 21SJ11W-1]UTA47286.1 hypothetical protein L1F30_14080 [Simiduia sp. 21SJ11W-1]